MRTNNDSNSIFDVTPFSLSLGYRMGKVTLTSLKVSADPDELIDDDDGEPLQGQSVTSSDPKTINYWLFSLMCALILLLWVCCFCLVREDSGINGLLLIYPFENLVSVFLCYFV